MIEDQTAYFYLFFYFFFATGASADPEEEVAWDEDSDTESPAGTPSININNETPASIESSSTLHPSPNKQTSTIPSINTPSDPPNERQAESRRSNDQQSHPDSDASYDLISGAPSKAPSHAPGSPKEVKKVGGGDESDEEDWE